MKTFKEWYDSLSERSQRYLNSYCYIWLDPDSQDGYRHKTINVEQVKSDLAAGIVTGYQANIASTIYYLMSELNKVNKEAVSDELLKLYEKEQADEYSVELFKCLPVERRKEIKRAERSVYAELDLRDLLFITEDYDNIDWSKLKVGRSDFNLEIYSEIMGKEQALQYIIKHPDTLDKNQLINSENKNDELFDRLFFGENGWDEAQRLSFIKSYPPHYKAVEDFMARIVAVDESYLRYIKCFIKQDPAIASYLYNQKKGEDEINDSMSVAERYRYPKDYRKLFQICACCERKNVGKAMTGLLMETASLMKIYSFDFDTIFDCLYPQYIKEPEGECLGA